MINSDKGQKASGFFKKLVPLAVSFVLVAGAVCTSLMPRKAMAANLKKVSVQSKSGSRKFWYITPGARDPGEEQGIRKKVPDAMFVYTSVQNAEDEILASVESQFERYGTLGLVTIDAHADPLRMSSSRDLTDGSLIDPERVLQKIMVLQAGYGKIITKEIYFQGCSVFADMPERKFNDFENCAKNLGIFISGNVTNGYGGRGVEVVVQFTPRGARIHPTLGTPISEGDLLIFALRDTVSSGHSPAWVFEKIFGNKKSAEKMASLAQQAKNGCLTPEMKKKIEEVAVDFYIDYDQYLQKYKKRPTLSKRELKKAGLKF